MADKSIFDSGTFISSGQCVRCGVCVDCIVYTLLHTWMLYVGEGQGEDRGRGVGCLRVEGEFRGSEKLV